MYYSEEWLTYSSGMQKFPCQLWLSQRYASKCWQEPNTWHLCDRAATLVWGMLKKLETVLVPSSLQYAFWSAMGLRILGSPVQSAWFSQALYCVGYDFFIGNSESGNKTGHIFQKVLPHPNTFSQYVGLIRVWTLDQAWSSILSLLSLSIFLGTLFSAYILPLMWDQISHPHKITSKIIVLYILNLKFLGIQWEE
jgi:hypothetical protein